MEITILYSIIILLTFELLAHLVGVIFYKNNFQITGGWLFAFGSVLLFSLLIIRWVNIGRPPIYGTYESMLLAALSVIIIYYLLQMKGIVKNYFTPVVLVLTIFFLAYGAMSDKAPAILGPAFRSFWLWFHIGFAWLAFSAFFISAILAALFLLKKRDLNQGLYDDLSFKVIIFGFISHSIEIGAGALWAYDLYGRYWGWDPIETWSLIVWIIYALYLHLRITLGWSSKKISWIAAFSPLLILIAYGGIIFLEGTHSPLI